MGNRQRLASVVAIVAGPVALVAVAACAPPPGGGPITLTNGPIVAAVGDSYLSGQGAPDVPVRRSASGAVLAPALWQDRGCARSSLSGPARTVRRLHELDPQAGRRSINLVNEACSDATVAAGLLGPQHLGDGTNRPSQLDQLAKAVGSRTVDALLVDGGGNDVHFADIVLNCAIPLHDCSTDPSILKEVRAGLAALNGPHGNDGLYRSLIAAVNGSPGHAAEVRVKDVYVTAYPDPTRNAAGGPCSSAPAGDPLAGITAAEATFGSGIVVSLNRSLAAMVTQANAGSAPHPVWHYVAATAPAFRVNGYCAGPGREVNTVLDSLRLQGDLRGSVHPNAFGYLAWGDVVGGQLAGVVRPAATRSDGTISGA
jgi:hypothetical protein